MNKKVILFLSIIASCQLSVAFAQEEEAPTPPKKPVVTRPTVPTKEISGTVIDAGTKMPAAGVRVTAYNDRRYAAMSDENGQYTIKVPTYATVLTFEAEGYSLVEQSIGGQSQLRTLMYSDKFKDIYTPSTTAQSMRTAKATYNNNDISIDNQIQSNFGGDIHTLTRSGMPGQGIAMFMNGINSLNANAQPLVIIDGVPQDMQLMRPSLHDGFFNNVLANIMVEDIEKISVLKNGTAIYGAKAANGVVVIETKRNKSMATRIDLSIGGSYELIPKEVDMMNAEQFRVYASELIGTTGTKSNSFKFLNTDPNYYYYAQFHNNTDWRKQVYNEAFTQNYSINVQGGDDVANYNLSVGYALADATLKNTDYSRFNMRFNTDISLSSKASVRFDASYSDVTRDMRDNGIKDNITDGIISSPSFLSLIKAPFLSPFAFDAQGNVSNYIAEADNYLNDVLANNSYRTSLANPVAILRNGDGDNRNNFGNRSITLSVRPKWDINRFWSITEHFAFSLVNTDQNYYLPTNGVPSYDVEGIGRVDNCSAALAGKQTVIMSDTYFNWNRRFNAHLFDVRGGLRYLNSAYKLDTQIGYNSGNDKTPNMSSSLSYKQTDGTEDKYVDMTYYAQANYNYAERYYLLAALALDGSSRFGVDAKDGIKIGKYAWGLFPSVAAAWVISNEPWYRLKGIDFLKLNVGFDMLGNDDVNSQVSRTYFVAGKMFNSISGKTLGNIGNTKLQWETTTRLTAGLQLAAVNNRVQFGFNYFRSTTSNLLSLNALSYLTGMNTNWTNGGKLSNEGFDANFNLRLIATKNWTWSLGASIGHYKNKIKELPNNSKSFTTELYGGTIISQVGQPAGMFYGYKTDGVFATTAEAAKANLYQVSSTGLRQYFGAGDMKFVDTNNDGIINDADRQVIGDPNPDAYGNIFTKLTYKHFALDVVFNYSLGNDIYNYQRSIIEGGNNFYNQTTAMLHRWTYEGQNTDIPHATYGDQMGNSRFSDRWIEDGSYLRLKNVTLSYDIPISNTYLQGITIWAAGSNLFTLTRYLGSDPEFAQSNAVLGQGIDRGLLSLGRNFSLGVKIKL